MMHINIATVVCVVVILVMDEEAETIYMTLGLLGYN